MQKKYLPFAFLFGVILVVLAVLGARLTQAVPAFTFAASEKRVYLTFDDGPSTKVTGRILDVLKAENVKATFFVVSDRTEGREEILRRIVNEGHTVGVHSATHDYRAIYASDESLLKDVDRCAKTVERITGVLPTVYRFPGGGGKQKTRQTALLEERGYRVVFWNAVCGDEETPKASADALFRRTVATAKGKSNVVLLCHDSAGHAATAEALPRIIAYFRSGGYSFCAY